MIFQMEGLKETNMSIPIPEGFIIGSRINGFTNNIGKASGLEQNWGYNAIDNEGNRCILIYCNPGHYTIIDTESLNKIRNVNGKQVSWFIGKNGYAGCRIKIEEKDTVLTLHQHLMNHYGHGRGKESIDHINRNKLDNRLDNLRITTQSVQNENRDKVKRHKTAKELPDEIKDVILPKFVVYYKEKVSEKTYREFFTVEGHPIQKLKEAGIENQQTEQLSARRWATTKSNRVSIKDKLKQAEEYLEQLDMLHEDESYIIQDIERPSISEPRKTNIKTITKTETENIVEIIKKEQDNIIDEVINNSEIKKKKIFQKIYLIIDNGKSNKSMKQFLQTMKINTKNIVNKIMISLKLKIGIYNGQLLYFQ